MDATMHVVYIGKFLEQVSSRNGCHPIVTYITNNKITQLAQIRGSFFMFVESGCISTNKEFTVP